jgi:hypothetical protein
MDSDAVAGMLRFECDYCHALPGQWCETPSGRRPAFLHSSRFYAWRDRDEAPGWPAIPNGATS